MPPRSKVASLPPEVKAWLDLALAESNFSDYEALAAELDERGFSISKSSLHRYGQNFEERLSALKMASEQAKALVAAAPDDDGTVNEALVRLTQERLLQLLVAPEGKIDISKIGKTVAELVKASVAQKKFAAEAEARRSALQEAANRIDSAAQARGLTAEEASFWRQQVLAGM